MTQYITVFVWIILIGNLFLSIWPIQWHCYLANIKPYKDRAVFFSMLMLLSLWSKVRNLVGDKVTQVHDSSQNEGVGDSISVLRKLGFAFSCTSQIFYCGMCKMSNVPGKYFSLTPRKVEELSLIGHNKRNYRHLFHWHYRMWWSKV